MSQTTELPEGYYCGKEFVEDPAQIDVEFRIHFFIPGVVQNRDQITQIGGDLVMIQEGSSLIVSFHKQISEKLFNDLCSGNGSRWLQGYVAEIFPSLNQELLSQRHKYGHFLIPTYNVFDVKKVELINHESKRGVWSDLAVPISEFPEIETFCKSYGDERYIKDLIDACHSYFQNDFEDSIRRTITSLEIFFKRHNLSAKHRNWVFRLFSRLTPWTESRIREKIKLHLDFVCELHNVSIAEQLIQVYKIRNDIVHNNKRYTPDELVRHSKNGIHYLLDAYKQFGTDEQLHEFVRTLEQQFVAHLQMVGQGVTLKNMAQLNNDD